MKIVRFLGILLALFSQVANADCNSVFGAAPAFDKNQLNARLDDLSQRGLTLSTYFDNGDPSTTIAAGTTIENYSIYNLIDGLKKCVPSADGKSVESKQTIELLNKIGLVLPSLNRANPPNTGTYSQYQVNVLQNIQQEALIEHLKYWKDKADALQYISYADSQILMDNLSIEDKKKFQENNKQDLAEFEKAEKIKRELKREYAVDEVNVLTEKLLRVGLSPDEKARLADLQQELGSENSRVGIDLPLTSYSNYPNPLTRFFYGGEAIATNRDTAKVHPTLGLYYYRQGDVLDFSNTVGFTSINNGVEGDSDDIVYNITADQLFYYSDEGWRTRLNKDHELKHGVLFGAALNVYEQEDADDNTEFVFRPDMILGYRAAWSPERYIDATVRKCHDLSDMFDFECYARVRIDGKIVTPTFAEDTKVQIGIGFDLKTNDDDVFSDAVILNFRFYSGIGDIYKNLLSNQ